MSDTIRSTSENPVWRPGHPIFERWNKHQPKHKQCKSRKHQQRDRQSEGYKGGKRGRFINGVRNCLYNLEKKVDDLRTQELLDSLTGC